MAIRRQGITVSLSPRAIRTLRELRDATDAFSYSEVIRAALALYARTLHIQVQEQKNEPQDANECSESKEARGVQESKNFTGTL